MPNSGRGRRDWPASGARTLEFKGFEIGKNIPSVLPTPELTARVKKLADGLDLKAPPDPKTIAPFVSDADNGVRALRREADRREREAKQLRRLAETLQLTRVEQQLNVAVCREG